MVNKYSHLAEEIEVMTEVGLNKIKPNLNRPVRKLSIHITGNSVKQFFTPGSLWTLLESWLHGIAVETITGPHLVEFSFYLNTSVNSFYITSNYRHI